MANVIFWIIFWTLYSILTPLVFKLYLSKSRELSAILRFILLALQIAILALVFMPWTRINGELYSGFRLAIEFSYNTIFVFVGLIASTAFLLILGNPTAVWLASILNIFNSIFLIYMGIKLSDATKTNVNEPAVIIEALLLLAGNIIAILLAASTKLDPDSLLGKTIYGVFGQRTYIRVLKETAQALSAQFIEPETIRKSKIVQGTFNTYNFKIYDFEKPVGGISTVGVFRVEIATPQNLPQFLFAFPKASSKYHAYLNNVIQSEASNPLNYLKTLPDVSLPPELSNEWLVKAEDKLTDEQSRKVVDLVREQFQNIKRGWIASIPNKIHFETTFMMRPKYAKEQLIAILILLTTIANLFKS